MDANLIIDDDYVQSVGESCDYAGSRLQVMMNQYVEILAEIEEEAITDGGVSKAVTAYKESVMLLSEKLSEITRNLKNVTECFIWDINEADDYLF